MSRHTYDRHLLGLSFAQSIEVRKPKEGAFLRYITPYISPRVLPERRDLLKGMLTSLHREAVALAESLRANSANPDMTSTECARSAKAGTKVVCDIADQIAAIHRTRSTTGQQIIRALAAEIEI